MSFFRKLLGLCVHKWTITEQGNLHRGDDYALHKMCVGRWYTLRCEKCGELKKEVVTL